MSALTPSPHPRSAARWQGLRVGLLGGSFNPAHKGHMHIAKQAIIRFKLHAVWWVVSPGNPLKTKNTVAAFEERLQAVRQFAKHPKMVATGIEAQLNTRYTYDTLKEFRRLFPRTKFIWIAGMDNAADFHRWDRWADLPGLVPFVFFDRPPVSAKIKGKRVRQNKRIRQRTEKAARALKPRETGVFWMLKGRAVNLSSTRIRAEFPLPLGEG